MPNLPAAVIFDMDGVLVDSNPFHLQKWMDLLKEHGIPFDQKELPEQILGKRNDTAFRHFFGSNLTEDEIQRLSEELEERFRRVFRPHARPLPGLERLVGECHAAGIPMAVASSAITANVEFIVEVLGFRPYFQALVSGDDVTHPKPHPEIYLKAARQLGVQPGHAVAFEDSAVGIEAAKNAGVKCVAIGSTFSLDDLRRTRADLVVPSFEALHLSILRDLFEAEKAAPRPAGS